MQKGEKYVIVFKLHSIFSTELALAGQRFQHFIGKISKNVISTIISITHLSKTLN